MEAVIDIDSRGEGLDLANAAALTETLRAQSINSIGFGLAQLFAEGYQAGPAAVATGSFFCQRDQNELQCRSRIRNAGISITIET